MDITTPYDGTPYSEIVTVFTQFDNEISKLDKRLIDFKARYNGKEIPDNIYLAIQIQQKGIDNLDGIKDYLFNFIRNQNAEINDLRSQLFRAKQNYMSEENRLETFAKQAAIMRPPTPIGNVFRQLSINLKNNNNVKAKAAQ